MAQNRRIAIEHIAKVWIPGNLKDLIPSAQNSTSSDSENMEDLSGFNNTKQKD